MRKALMIATSMLFVGTMAMAADSETSGSTTVDTSKNPITGSVTTTKKVAKKKKGAHGEHEIETTEKTTVKKDGTVQKKTETEEHSTH